MNKADVMKLRVEEPIRQAFRDACESANETQSRVIRDFMRAVPSYIERMGGRWYPPKLVQDVPASTSGRKEKAG